MQNFGADIIHWKCHYLDLKLEQRNFISVFRNWCWFVNSNHKHVISVGEYSIEYYDIDLHELFDKTYTLYNPGTDYNKFIKQVVKPCIDKELLEVLEVKKKKYYRLTDFGMHLLFPFNDCTIDEFIDECVSHDTFEWTLQNERDYRAHEEGGKHAR